MNKLGKNREHCPQDLPRSRARTTPWGVGLATRFPSQRVLCLPWGPAHRGGKSPSELCWCRAPLGWGVPELSAGTFRQTAKRGSHPPHPTPLRLRTCPRPSGEVAVIKGRRLRTVLVPQPPSLSRARADCCSPGWKGGREGSINLSSEAAQRPQPGALNPRHRPYRKPRPELGSVTTAMFQAESHQRHGLRGSRDEGGGRVAGRCAVPQRKRPGH